MINTIKLKILLLERGLSQRELAKKIGMNKNSLNNKINNNAEFKANEINKLATALGITDAEEFKNIFFA